MNSDVTTPTVQALKAKLASLSLLFLGQHIWGLRIYFGGTASETCHCRACDEARKAYEYATGIWPTKEQQNKAMEDWGRV